MDVAQLLRDWADSFNQPHFITEDPISVPHSFVAREDQEIAGLFAALFSWGRRATILAKSKELLQRMGNKPHHYILNSKDFRALEGFKHRTFNDTDLMGLCSFLRDQYRKHNSLEDLVAPAFARGGAEEALIVLYHSIMNHPLVLPRTSRHLGSPDLNSACKRLNMYLRWMVRRDDRGVDLGLWTRVAPAQLVIPLDLHSGRVARKLGLLERPINDWKAAKELTQRLQLIDPQDPVRFDFALFGAGVHGLA